MKRLWAGASVLLTATFLLTGCGDALNLGKNASLQLDALTQQAKFDFELSDGTELSLAGNFPIYDNKVSLSFVAATRTSNAKIEIIADLKALSGNVFDGLEVMNTLPNGAPLPVAMTPPLMKVPVTANKTFQVDAAFALIPELQMGSLIGIAQMSSKYFPDGVSLCQNFRNQDKVAFAAICAYGGSGSKNGGLFVGANFGEVLKLKPSVPENSNRMLALTASSVYSVPTSELMVVKSVKMQTSDSENKIHDPKKKLAGKNGEKAARNLEKILGRK